MITQKESPALAGVAGLTDEKFKSYSNTSKSKRETEGGGK